VSAEPNIVDLPRDVLKSMTMPVFAHLFGRRHHAGLSTAAVAEQLGALS
jgi:hypothetical protein